MNFVALFITHKNMNQVSHLLKFFDHSKVECFVHIDKKYKVDFCKTKYMLERQSNVHVLEERLSGTLSDWSLIRITMLLIQSAKRYADKKGITFHYYGLFSGQDYPIKPWSEFWNAMEQGYPKCFIDITKYGKNGLADMFDKVRYWKAQNFLYTYIQNSTVRKFCKVPVYAFEKMTTFFEGKPLEKLEKMEINIYQGSAWWIINEEIIYWILEQYETEGEYIKVIKNTSTPEEHFFQTMCMMSPLRKYLELGDNKHIFCNFTPEGKVITGHPYIIEKTDFMKAGGDILNSPFYFARKFDMEGNVDAIEWIDLHILKTDKKV